MNHERLSYEDFVINAILSLRKSKILGIHTIYSGFNDAFKEYYQGEDPEKIIYQLAEKGVINIRPEKWGATLSLPDTNDVRIDEQKFQSDIKTNERGREEKADVFDICIPNIPELPDMVDNDSSTESLQDYLTDNNQSEDDHEKNFLLDILTGASNKSPSEKVSQPQLSQIHIKDDKIALNASGIIQYVIDYFSINSDILAFRQTENELKIYSDHKDSIFVITLTIKTEIRIRAYMPYIENTSCDVLRIWANLECPGNMTIDKSGPKDYFAVTYEMNLCTNKNDLLSMIDKIIDGAKTFYNILEITL